MRRWVWLVAAVVIVTVGYEVWRIASERVDRTIAVSDEQWCNHDWPDSTKVIQIGDFTDVPEFNDCQRFVLKSGGTYAYDSLFAIFVAPPKLDSIGIRLGPPVQLPPYVTVTGGRLGVTGSTGIANPTLALSKFIENLRSAMVAVVYATGPYATLGIQPKLNCLYVWRVMNSGPPPQPETWFARMVPKDTVKTCPDTNVANIGAGKDLQVSRAQVPGFSQTSDYPSVARWDWDDAHGKQYVGIGCEAAWCEVYDGTLTTSQSLPTESSDPDGVRRVRLIKGWYDQQFLATVDASGKLVPSGVTGTIVPDPDLGRATGKGFQAGWVHVADIALESANAADPAIDKYKSKLNFIRTPITDPIKLSLKGKEGEAVWKARIARKWLFGFPLLRFKSVTRREMPGPAGEKLYVPLATARWRWMSTDEGTWTRCTAGCCEMKP